MTRRPLKSDSLTVLPSASGRLNAGALSPTSSRGVCGIRKCPFFDRCTPMSAGSSRVVGQGSANGAAWREEVADRDPDTIKRDIDQARDQLASTVDSLAERANPRRVAGDVKAAVARFVKKPAVAVSLAGVDALMLALLVRRI